MRVLEPDKIVPETCRPLRGRWSPVLIGRGLLDRLAEDISRNQPASMYAIITDRIVRSLHAVALLQRLQERGLPALLLDFPAGERFKRIETVIEIASSLVRKGMDRQGCIIACGGGVVGDLAGFLASIYMRSIPYVQVPTTLLAQVDSSLGGKTGIDMPEGKNLLGSFYQPCSIYIDISLLDTLPQYQIRNGAAELIKYGCLRGGELFEILEESPDAILERDPDLMEEVISRACRIKLEIAGRDETDRGQRRLLNLGHTLGHAVEAASEFSLLHGEAVSIGLVAAAMISVESGNLALGLLQRIRRLITSYGLPTALPEGIPPDSIIEFLMRDKKRNAATLPFVLIRDLGAPFISENVPMEAIIEVMEELYGGEG